MENQQSNIFMEDKPVVNDIKIIEQETIVDDVNEDYTSVADEVKANKMDPNRLEEEKKSINYYLNFYGENAQIIAAQTISGSNIQYVKGGNEDIAESKEIEMPSSLETMESYLQKLYVDDSFFSFITVTFLKTVKDSSLHEIAQQLKIICQGEMQLSSSQIIGYKVLPTKYTLIERIFATTDVYEIYTATETAQVQCIHLINEEQRVQWMQWIWELIPGYRGAIITWLFKIARDHDLFLAQLAQEAVMKCASFSFYDFQKLILPHFKTPSHSYDISWLAAIFHYIGQDLCVRDNVISEIKRQILHRREMLTLGFYLKDYLGIPQLKNLVIDSLVRVILGRIKVSKDAVLIPAIAQAKRHEMMCDLLMQALIQAQQTALYTEREALEDTYLRLSMADYLTASDSRQELLLLNFESSKIRNTICPIFLHCWKKRESARFLETVWDAYFGEAAKKKYSLHYTKQFWQRMAFQNSPVEFNRTLSFLRKRERAYPDLSDFFTTMREQLEDTLNKRKRSLGNGQI